MAASAATKKRLKALRKKHNLGESSNKSKKSSTVRTKSRSSKVAKRKTATRKKSGFFSGLNKPLLGGVIYAIAQPIVSTFLARFNIGIADEIIQIIVALFAKLMLKNPLVGAYANAAILINVASLTRQVVSGGGLGGFFGGRTVTQGDTTMLTSSSSIFPALTG